MLKAYLLSDNKDQVLLPQSAQFFKYKIGQRVFFDRPKSERQRLSFRYTFDGPGKQTNQQQKNCGGYLCKIKFFMCRKNKSGRIRGYCETTGNR